MMKRTTFGKICVGTAALACAWAVAAPQAQAAGWNYSWDSFADGTGNRNQNGGDGRHSVGYQSDYEFFGMAVLEDLEADTITFAFNTNLNIDGWYSNGAQDKNIGIGDLFINLDPTKSFTEVEGTESLLAVRFAKSNDSGLSGTGLFSNVVGSDVTNVNNGWQSYSDYQNYVNSKGGSFEYIDGLSNSAAMSYLGQHGESVVQAGSGTKLGDVNVTTDALTLGAMGLDFTGAASAAGLNSPALGTQTYAVSFARSLLPAGELNWMAHVMAECANDIMGTSGSFAAVPPAEEEVPEPTALAALALLGVGMLGARKRRA
ncbi:MAG: PEP-CTERM sorting domain-containing protein [Spirulinaceae cyanobacterium SM2_1_0]|nr:PEP-CTERM sorting domain-containing protein [Spirulinaceae cyanobacterium SM2_1_0]